MKKTAQHPYPRVGVATFVMKDGKFLMAFRTGNHGAGSWGLPGGKLELGESWEDAGRRETAEEVGVEVTNFRFLAATNDIFESESLHYTTIFLKADWVSGKPQLLEPDKFKEWRWFSYDKMPEVLMLPLVNLREAHPKLDLS